VIARLREDYVARDEASAYAGGATRRWLKVKQKGWAVEEDRWQRRISTGVRAAIVALGRARGRVIQPAARARRFCCFFLNAARLRAVFRLRFFSRMASLLSDLGQCPGDRLSIILDPRPTSAAGS
jgi:hypothetical protein